MDWIAKFLLILLIKLVYPASVSPTPGQKSEELNTRSYQVTENIIDIPDNRTLPSIINNFTLARPLNFGNNTVAAYNNLVNNNKENNSEESSEENNNDKLKKHSFSILHIKAEYDDGPVESQHHQNVLSKVFGGVKEYVYHLKRGVVDGLHSFFHKNDEDSKPDKKPGFHDKFHRNFDGVEDIGEHHYYNSDDDDNDDVNDDDDDPEHFDHY